MFATLSKIKRLPISHPPISVCGCPLVSVRDFVLLSDLGEEVWASLKGSAAEGQSLREEEGC